MIRQFLGNHNHTSTYSSSSSSSQQTPKKNGGGMHKRGKSYGYYGGRSGGQVDDNSSITTGITEFSRSMSRDAPPLRQVHEHPHDEDGDSNTDGTGILHLRRRASSLDASNNSLPFPSSSHPMPSALHPPRSKSSHNNNKRKKKNKDNQTKEEQSNCDMTHPPPPPQNDTIEFIDLKDPAPIIIPTTTKDENEVDIMAVLEEYTHEIKRLERLNATLTANLETLTAAALLNGEENGLTSSTTASTTNPAADGGAPTDGEATQQPCPNCSHCGKSGSSGGDTTTNPPPSNNDIYNDMMLTETHYLSKITKLQKSNHKLTLELERKKKLISQLLLNLSMAADKIKELSSEQKSNNNNESEGGRLEGNHATHDHGGDNDGNVDICSGDAEGRRRSEASMQQIRQYQIQVVENELQSLLQVMNTRSTLHAQRRHTLIDDYRRGDSGKDERQTLGKVRMETPEEILQRVVRNLRGGDHGSEAGQQADQTTTEAQRRRQQQLGDEEESTLPPPSPVTLPPPSPVASLILANDVSSATASLKSGSGGGTNNWDSVTSLFYGPGHQPHPQAQPRPQLQSYRQPPNEVVPGLDIHEHPMCEEVKSFDRNCLRRVSPTANASRREDEEKDDEGLSGSNCSDGNADAKEMDCSADTSFTAAAAASATDDAIVAQTNSSNDVSLALPLGLESQDDMDDEAKSSNYDCKATAFDDGISEDNRCHGPQEPSSTSDDTLDTGEDTGSEEQTDTRSIGYTASEEKEKGNVTGDGSFTDKAQVIDDADNREEVTTTEVVSVHEQSSDKEAGDMIERISVSKQCKTSDIESDTPSGLTSSETLLDDDTQVNNTGNVAKIDRYDTELEDPSHDDDAIADVYTAKEPKDDGESLEQACMRSGDAEGEKIECNPANICIVQVGGEDDQIVLDTDNEHGEINEMAGFESSYIGMVSLSNIEPERNVSSTRLEYDKPDSGSNFEQKLSQLSSTPSREGLNSSVESMTITSTVPASTCTSEMGNSTTSTEAVKYVEKLVAGNKTLSETLGTIQSKRVARLDDSVDDRSTMYHHSIASLYRKPSSTNSYGDDSLSIRLGRRELFQYQGPLDISDIHPDVYGDWQILIKSTDNSKYFVPRYKTPVLPPQSINRGIPLFKKGFKDGHYRYASSSGNEYSGHWVKGKRHGYGMAKYHDGEVYHGQWRRGRRHGHGVLHLSNREVFDGYWSANKKHGLGMYFWTDGEVDISWYQDDIRLESLRWTSDRRRAYRLDLASSKKEQISLARAADIVRDWERKLGTDVD
jgi:hypothetical protein